MDSHYLVGPGDYGKTEMSVKVHNIKIPDGRRHQSNHKNEEAIN